MYKCDLEAANFGQFDAENCRQSLLIKEWHLVDSTNHKFELPSFASVFFQESENKRKLRSDKMVKANMFFVF